MNSSSKTVPKEHNLFTYTAVKPHLINVTYRMMVPGSVPGSWTTVGGSGRHLHAGAVGGHTSTKVDSVTGGYGGLCQTQSKSNLDYMEERVRNGGYKGRAPDNSWEVD